MACLRSWIFEFEALNTSTTTPQFIPKTPWFYVSNGADVSATIRTFGLIGNARLYLGWQFAATRPTDIAGSAALDTAITTSGTVVRGATLGAGSYMWARLGYVLDLTSGEAQGNVTVGMDLSLYQCGQVIGSQRVNVPPNLAATAATPDNDDALVIPVTDFVPAIGSPKLKAAIIARDLVNYASVRTQLVYRTAKDRSTPTPWQFGTLEGYDTPSNANDERNTGELTPSVSGYQWLQAGLAVLRANGGDKIRGDLDVATAIIR